jgi:predicted transport protein
MSDIKLFRLSAGQATELQGNASDLERPLQTLIEANLKPLLNIRFMASEYSTGKTHGGRIDSLGLDENNCPVILEYKRSVGENVINQGLFYLDWLMDHKAEFKLLVLDKLGPAVADAIDWSAPRVVCIAADFTKYDGHAVQQIGRNIELMPTTSAPAGVFGVATNGKTTGPDKSFAELLVDLPEPTRQLFDSLADYTLSLGDDVQRKDLRLYAAFKRLKNFATVVLHKKNCLILYLHVNPATAVAVLPKARDLTNIGHWGTGNLEVTISSMADLDAAKPFINAAYEGRA